jgi:hypothetical protein
MCVDVGAARWRAGRSLSAYTNAWALLEISPVQEQICATLCLAPVCFIVAVSLSTHQSKWRVKAFVFTILHDVIVT